MSLPVPKMQNRFLSVIRTVSGKPIAPIQSHHELHNPSLKKAGICSHILIASVCCSPSQHYYSPGNIWYSHNKNPYMKLAFLELKASFLLSFTIFPSSELCFLPPLGCASYHSGNSIGLSKMTGWPLADHSPMLALSLSTRDEQ